MRIFYPPLNAPLIFDESKINVLVVENQNLLTEMVFDFVNQKNGLEGKWVLSKDYTPLSLSKSYLIVDPFNLELNSRSVTTKIYSLLTDIANNECYDLMKEAEIKVNELIENLISSQNINLSYNDINLQSLLKSVKLEVGGCDSTDISENIVDFISTYSNLLECDLFVFLNLRSYISDDKIDKLYEMFVYEKVNVLLLESSVHDLIEKYENRTIIDKDLCIIN